MANFGMSCTLWYHLESSLSLLCLDTNLLKSHQNHSFNFAHLRLHGWRPCQLTMIGVTACGTWSFEHNTLKSVCYKGVRGVRGRVVSLRVRGEIHVLWSDLRWTFECLKGITALELACETPIWLHMLDIHPPNPHKSMADSRRAREQQVCCLC